MRICPSDHAHAANLTCYFSHGCGCDACSRAAALYRRRRATRLADSDAPPAFIPTEHVALHLAKLLDAGATLAGVAAAAQVPRSLLERVRDSRSWGKRGTRFEAASRILQLDPETSPAITDEALVPSLGLRRRVEALMVDGWPVRIIAQAAGLRYDSLRTSLYRDRVRHGTVRRIDQIFQHPRRMLEEYAHLVSDGERRRVQRAARRRGFAPALAWDRIDHDRAPARPEHDDQDVDEVAVDLAARGHTVSLRPREAAKVRRLRPASSSKVAAA